MFDFLNDDFRKKIDQQFEFLLGGTPILTPQSVASLKMTTPALTNIFISPITPHQPPYPGISVQLGQNYLVISNNPLYS